MKERAEPWEFIQPIYYFFSRLLFTLIMISYCHYEELIWQYAVVTLDLDIIMSYHLKILAVFNDNSVICCTSINVKTCIQSHLTIPPSLCRSEPYRAAI